VRHGLLLNGAESCELCAPICACLLRSYGGGFRRKQKKTNETHTKKLEKQIQKNRWMEVWKTDGETERCNSQVIGAFCLCRASLGADTFVVCHFARFSVHCAIITDSCEVPVRASILVRLG